MKSIRVLWAVLLTVSGSTWVLAAEPVRVVPEGAIINPRQPQAAVDSQKNIYVAFGSGESIYCSTSTDDGKSFGTPNQVGSVQKLALGKRRGPRIVAGNGFAVITVISHESGNVLAWRSTDRGQKWEGPVQVNDSSRDAREGLHAMALGPDGQLFCVWLDCRDQTRGSRIFGAGSTDGGKTWTPNRQVYRSPSGTVCECCHPSVAFDRQGNLYAMWRNSLDGNRDLYAAVSHDGGQTFVDAEKLGDRTWRLEGCPMDGGCLAATAPGKLTSIWRSQKQIYRTDSGRPQAVLLGDGEQPWATANAEGSWLVWISHRGGDLYLAAPKAEQPTKLAQNATDPSIATSATTLGPVVAVWETGDIKNKTGAILAAVVNR